MKFIKLTLTPNSQIAYIDMECATNIRPLPDGTTQVNSFNVKETPEEIFAQLTTLYGTTSPI